MPTSRSRLDELTSLRFFAAATVTLFHLKVDGAVEGGPWWYENFAAIGYIGVNFFFTLSGFILVYSYDGREYSPAGFWRSRFARIYPAYLFSLLLALPGFMAALDRLDLPFFAWSKAHFTLSCFLTLTLLQAWVPQGALTWNPVCWSLSVEAFFYALFPFLKVRRPWVLLIGSCLVSLALSLAYLLLHPDGADKINSTETTLLWKNVLSFDPLARLPEFLAGMAAGGLFLGEPTGTKRAAWPLVSGGLAVLAILVLLVGKIPVPLISAGFLSPAFAAIIYGVALLRGRTGVLAAPLLVLLGEASYSLYLIHSLVIGRVLGLMPDQSSWIKVPLAVAAAIAVALAIYWLVERPARKLLQPRPAAPNA